MEEGAIIKHDIKKAPKTGEWSIYFPEISEKCIACGTCVAFCPEAAIGLTERKKEKKSIDKKIAKIDFDFCKGCGVCARVCPVKAIIMKKK
jgi:pyruvate ferredoxin oxidoreductase delta subunit